MRPRSLLVVLAAALALAGAAVASLAVGARSVAPGDVVAAFVAPDTTSEGYTIVRELRLPRLLVGLVAGSALGVAGGLLRAVTRNPIADPGVLGLTAGAALAAALATDRLGVRDPRGYVWFAFAGTAAAGALVAAGGRGRHGPDPGRLALAGAAVTALCGSLAALVILSDVTVVGAVQSWSVGSLERREAEVAAQLAPFAVLGLLTAVVVARSLEVEAMGADVATALGLRRDLVLGATGVAIVLLVGSATAAAGPIAFLGLAVAYVARSVCGPNLRVALVFSALLGAAALLIADVLGRVIAPPGEVRAGVVTALAGAPLFVVLVRRRAVSGG